MVHIIHIQIRIRSETKYENKYDISDIHSYRIRFRPYIEVTKWD
jgi:hypothetical protein